MLKKYYLVLWILIFSCNTQASIWDSIAACFTDPCNCGQSSVTEIWNAGTTNAVTKTFKPGTLCPPWNKGSGRDQDTCLLQYDYPGTFIGFYLQRCAEATPESNYFAPKIRIRIQSCNALACWNQSSTLNWDGECVVWPTGYGLPLTRVCARVAVPTMPAPPGLNAQDSPADPGYTAGFNLNSVGYREQDPTIIGSDGQIIPIEAPKLCAYSDPGLVNLLSDSGAHLDPMDWNPNSQPLHQTNALSPIAQVLQFLVNTVKGGNLPNLLGQLLNMIGSDNAFLNILQKIFNAIGEIFNFFPDLILKAIETLGALNSSVDSYSFGCVNLPLGPFPPPFCPSLNQLTVSPLLHNICSQKNSDGTFNQTSTILPCVVSNVRNNVINNTVRVGFNNLIPLCTGNTPDLTTCVQIQGPFSSASSIHTATSFTDIIQPCGLATSGAPCINTKIPLTCSVTANGCNQGFRIAYSQETGNTSTASDYYISDLPDCASASASTSTTCQQILGVNIGEFVDISVAFPSIQDQNNLTPIQQTFSLKDNNGTNRNFYAQIVNTATPQQSPENICVFESALLVNCQARVDSGYNLVTYECGEHAGLSCSNNTYYTPQFIASIQVRDNQNTTTIIDETNSVITPLSITGTPSSTATETIAVLAGYAFSSSVAYIPTIPSKDANDQYTAMPFSGPRSVNQLTIYGKYKNNISPYNKTTGVANPNAVYLKYLEYLNGKYIQGGTHACLMPQNFQHCTPLPPPPVAENSSVKIPQPPESTLVNCTLAKLTETDTVNCKQFKNIASSKYPNLGMCQDRVDTSQCTSDTSSVSGITIYNCGGNYCYINKKNADIPVCVLSQDYQNRISPSPNIGPILTDSQYYAVQYDSSNNYIVQDANGRNQTYTLDIADVRDKTSQELNLCVPIPIPTCAATTENGVIWPKSNMGDLAMGKCQSNWIPIDPTQPLQRYCLSNFNSKTAAFEPLTAGTGCKEFNGINIKQVNNTILNPKPLVNTYDRNSKIGTLSTEYSSAYGAKGTVFTVSLSVEIDTNMLSNIEYFKIKQVVYDDWVLVKVNNQQAFMGPENFDIGMCTNNRLRDQGGKSTKNEINIIPMLSATTNTISFQLCSIGGGGLSYVIEYKMKN